VNLSVLPYIADSAADGNSAAWNTGQALIMTFRINACQQFQMLLECLPITAVELTFIELHINPV
jgi:hypothetical protein